nr:MAG TPA: hypothetical protein [Caudoviricetes sp.]
MVDVISNRLHPLAPPDQQKAPSSRELGASAPATGFEPVTVRLSAWSQCYLFVSFAPELG